MLLFLPIDGRIRFEMKLYQSSIKSASLCLYRYIFVAEFFSNFLFSFRLFFSLFLIARLVISIFALLITTSDCNLSLYLTI